MTLHLQRDLDKLQRDLHALAGLVEATVHKAVEALHKRDTTLAQEVIDSDPQIDEEENNISEDCLKILALHQPVASDLRLIVTAMMICTDLERMGDLAEDIAERTLALATAPEWPVPDTFQKMTDLATMMVRQSLDAFGNANVQQAAVVIRTDDEVDRLNVENIKVIMNTMKEKPELIEAGLSLFSATRHLERIADHATNIAEDVIYLVDGRMVRHRIRTEPQ